MGACQSNAGASVSDNVVKVRNVSDASKKDEGRNKEDEKSSANVIISNQYLQLLGCWVHVQHRQFLHQKYKKVSSTRPLGSWLNYHGKFDVGTFPRWHDDGREEQPEDK